MLEVQKNKEKDPFVVIKRHVGNRSLSGVLVFEVQGKLSPAIREWCSVLVLGMEQLWPQPGLPGPI